MNAASHLLSPTVPGYGTSDGRCLPCSGISGGSFNISPCSSRSDYKTLPKFKVIHLRCGSRGSTLSICNAHSVGKKRNPDYSRRNKQGGDSINRNSRQEENDIDDEESEFFPKNGPMISGSPQYQATATPGRNEKEIVEMFKKILVQLRKNGAYKDVKKVAYSSEPKTANTLIDILRQALPQGKERNINGNKSGLFLVQSKENDPDLEGKTRIFSGSTKRVKHFAKERFDKPKQNSAVVEDKSHISLGLKDKVTDAPQDSKRASFSRPPSNFQRRSPIPPFKYKPICSNSDEEATVNSARLRKINGKREKTLFEPESKPELDIEPELEQEPEQLAEAESFLSDESGSESEFIDLIGDEDAIKDDDEENGDKDLSGMETQEVREHVELHLMKVVELKALAKSRGLKGISRLNKQGLVELLSSSGGSI